MHLSTVAPLVLALLPAAVGAQGSQSLGLSNKFEPPEKHDDPASAQTRAKVVLGGHDALGGDWQNPPGLADGTLASATIDFTFTKTARLLEVIVTNTSTPIPGVPTPVITDVYFNVPRDGVTSIQLLDQVSATQADPNFLAQLETLGSSSDPSVAAGDLGAFGVHLSNADGLTRAIGNAVAGLHGGPEPLLGPVLFRFLVTGPGADAYHAGAFARSFSVLTGQQQANAAALFRGGENGAAGIIGNAPSCMPVSWTVGEPIPGQTLMMYLSGGAGCGEALFVSLFPGPTAFEDQLLPIGFPAVTLLPGFQPDTNIRTKGLGLPAVNGILGLNIYFMAASVHPDYGLEFSPGFSVQVRRNL